MKEKEWKVRHSYVTANYILKIESYNPCINYPPPNPPPPPPTTTTYMPMSCALREKSSKVFVD